MTDLSILWNFVPVLVILVAIITFQKSTRVAMIFGGIANLAITYFRSTEAILPSMFLIVTDIFQRNYTLLFSLPVLGIFVYLIETTPPHPV